MTGYRLASKVGYKAIDSSEIKILKFMNKLKYLGDLSELNTVSHLETLASLLLLFFSLIANGKAVCTLLEKNVELRKYSFKCNNEIVNIQCERKNKNVCIVDIKDKLMSMNFVLTEDQFNSMNLFSVATSEKAECDASKRLCKIKKEVCNTYKEPVRLAREEFQKSMYAKEHCATGVGPSILGLSAFSSEFISQSDFPRDSCDAGNNQFFSVLKKRISFLENNINLPFSDSRSLINMCVPKRGKGENYKTIDEIVTLNLPALNKLKSIVLSKMRSPENLKDLICFEGSDILYNGGNLEIDKLMCLIMEESVFELKEGNISCESEVRNSLDQHQDSTIASSAGAKIAKSDTTPIEQKPMPEAMASQIGKPVGLTPALARVDQVVPGSGLVASEPRSADAALRAGQVFAPVYEKLSTMGQSVGLSRPSARKAIIGRGSPARSGATGIVTVTPKIPKVSHSSPSGASADIVGTPSAVGAATASIKTQTVAGRAADSGVSKKPAEVIRNTNSGQTVQALGGRRSLGLNSVGASSGGSRGPSNSEASVATGGEDLPTATNVQKKITQLNSAAQIASFFKEEAVNIPNFRKLLYSDATSKVLASKGIRIVNQSGGESGAVDKVKYLIRDDGSKFTPLNLVKKR